jgi:hypothetical protein
MTSSTTASQEELKAAKVPVAWRDGCSAYAFHHNLNKLGAGSHEMMQFAVAFECLSEKQVLLALGM